MTVKIKIFASSTILIASALFFGYALSAFGQARNLNSLIPLLVATIIFLALFLLQSLIIKNFLLAGGLCLAETAAIAIPFLNKFSLLLAGASIVVFLLLFSAVFSNRQQFKNILKFHFFAVSGQFIARASVALILFGVVVYAGSLSFRDIVDLLLKSNQPAMQNIIGQFIPGAPSNIYGQVQNLLSSQLLSLPKIVQQLSVIGFAVLIFFSVKGVFFVINWAITPLAFVIYKILIATNFIKIIPEPRTKEVISL